jgi:hypothetical protein
LYLKFIPQYKHTISEEGKTGRVNDQQIRGLQYLTDNLRFTLDLHCQYSNKINSYDAEANPEL